MQLSVLDLFTMFGSLVVTEIDKSYRFSATIVMPAKVSLTHGDIGQYMHMRYAYMRDYGGENHFVQLVLNIFYFDVQYVLCALFTPC